MEQRPSFLVADHPHPVKSTGLAGEACLPVERITCTATHEAAPGASGALGTGSTPCDLFWNHDLPIDLPAPSSGGSVRRASQGRRAQRRSHPDEDRRTTCHCAPFGRFSVRLPWRTRGRGDGEARQHQEGVVHHSGRPTTAPSRSNHLAGTGVLSVAFGQDDVSSINSKETQHGEGGAAQGLVCGRLGTCRAPTTCMRTRRTTRVGHARPQRKLGRRRRVAAPAHSSRPADPRAQETGPWQATRDLPSVTPDDLYQTIIGGARRRLRSLADRCRKAWPW
jgi:hypothetical protein